MRIKWIAIMLLTMVMISFAGKYAHAEDDCVTVDVKFVLQKHEGKQIYEVIVSNLSNTPVSKFIVYTRARDEAVVEQLVSPTWWKGTVAIEGKYEGFAWEAYTSAKYIKPGETVSGFKVVMKEPSDIFQRLKFRVYLLDEHESLTIGCGDVVFQE